MKKMGVTARFFRKSYENDVKILLSFLEIVQMSENRGRGSTKPTRRRTKLCERIDIDTIVTFPLPDFEWNRSDACVNLSSRRHLSLASTKLSHSKP